jgi:hypothetical protein
MQPCDGTDTPVLTRFLSAVLPLPQPGQKFDLHADDYDRITPLHRGRRNLTCLIYVHTEPDETGELHSAAAAHSRARAHSSTRARQRALIASTK